MAKGRKWTKEEDKILVQAIKVNPHNRVEAFRKAAAQLNRTVGAIHHRWYYILSNPENPNYVGCLFTLIGYKSNYNNRTVYSSQSSVSPDPTKRGIWTKIKKLLHIK